MSASRNKMQEEEQNRDKNYDLYYAVFYNEPRDVHYLLKMGANKDYIIPGKGESTIQLALRLKESGKLCDEIKKMLGL